MKIRVIVLNYGYRLELEDGTPVRLTAADGKNFLYKVTKVLRFWHRIGRWCVGDLELEDERGHKRTIHFINASPIFGFLMAWDDQDMWNEWAKFVSDRWKNIFSSELQH